VFLYIKGISENQSENKAIFIIIIIIIITVVVELLFT